LKKPKKAKLKSVPGKQSEVNQQLTKNFAEAKLEKATLTICCISSSWSSIIKLSFKLQRNSILYFFTERVNF